MEAMLLAALQKNTESVVAIVVHSHRFADIEAFYVQQWQGALIPTYGPAILTGHGTEMCVREQSNMCLQLLAGLMPDVLHNMSPNLVKQIRAFSKSFDGMTTKALKGLPESLVQAIMKVSIDFSQKLRRYTGLNHLADAARTVLNNAMHVGKIREDYSRLVFSSIVEQMSWVFPGCSGPFMSNAEAGFRRLLEECSRLEQWAHWMQDIVRDYLQPHLGTPNFAVQARELMLRWSLISSLVIRDLTLRSAASFGMCHLLRLLCDEYMFFLIEKAMEDGQCPNVQHEANGGDPIASLTEMEGGGDELDRSAASGMSSGMAGSMKRPSTTWEDDDGQAAKRSRFV